MHPILSPRLFIELLSRIRSNIDLEKLNSRPAAKFNFEPLTITLSAWKFSQFCTHLAVQWSRPYLINKDVLGDCVNILLESGRWYDAQKSPLINYASCSIMEASQVGQVHLGNPCCLFLTAFLSFVSLETASTRTCSTIFLGAKLMLISLCFADPPLFFSVDGCRICPFPVIQYLWSLQPVKDERVALQELSASLDTSHQVFSIYDGK